MVSDSSYGHRTTRRRTRRQLKAAVHCMIVLLLGGCSINGKYLAPAGAFGGQYLTLHRDGSFEYLMDSDVVDEICTDRGTWARDLDDPDVIITTARVDGNSGETPPCSTHLTRRTWTFKDGALVSEDGVGLRKP